jgi:hypothetical protein
MAGGFWDRAYECIALDDFAGKDFHRNTPLHKFDVYIQTVRELEWDKVDSFRFPCKEMYDKHNNTISGITHCLCPDIAHSLAPPPAILDGSPVPALCPREGSTDHAAVEDAEPEGDARTLADACDGFSIASSSSSSSSGSSSSDDSESCKLDDVEPYDPKDPRWLPEDERPDPDARPSGLLTPERTHVPTIGGGTGGSSAGFVPTGPPPLPPPVDDHESASRKGGKKTGVKRLSM